MSSILRALKKLEDETARQNDFPRWPNTKDKIRAVNKPVKRAWLSSKSFLILSAAVIIVFSGWLLLYERPYIIKSPSPEIVPSSPKEKGEQMDTVSLFETKGRNTKPVIETTSDLLQKKPNRPEALSQDTSILKDRADAYKSANKEPKPAALKQPDTIKHVLDSKLELQAIAWSIDPNERIAVINGQIVREGESIEGFSVVRISSESVIVERGAKEWELIFRLN